MKKQLEPWKKFERNTLPSMPHRFRETAKVKAREALSANELEVTPHSMAEGSMSCFGM